MVPVPPDNRKELAISAALTAHSELLITLGLVLATVSVLGGMIVAVKAFSHHTQIPFPRAYERFSTLFTTLALASVVFLVVGTVGATP